MEGLSVTQLSVTYSHQDKSHFDVLQNIDLEIDSGELICILGSSGCGKSTLLNAIAGLTPYHTGSIRWKGDLVKGPALDRGIVFQHYSLFPWLTAEKNLDFTLEAAGHPKSTRRKLASQFLDLVGLSAYKNFFPRQMSGGMQQRLALARTFATNASLLLLDEPFGAVDALTRTYLQDLLLTLWEHSKKTIIMVTHDVDEALLLADRIVVLTPNPGRVKEIRNIPFKRPRRREDLLLSSSYQALRIDLLHQLQQELLEEITSEKSQVTALWNSLNGGTGHETDYAI